MQKMLFASLLTLASSSLAQNSTSVQLAGEGTALHPPGDYVIVNGTRLWFESEGTGQTLVLIPAGPGVPHGYLHPHLSPLAKTQRVIYYDAFGTGKSDHAQGDQKYTFAPDVENVEGLRKALKLGKIDVLGHSYGGMVAQAYAGKLRN
jgi:proline iminopeptidase